MQWFDRLEVAEDEEEAVEAISEVSETVVVVLEQSDEEAITWEDQSTRLLVGEIARMRVIVEIYKCNLL